MCARTRLDACPACGGEGRIEHVTHYRALDGAPDGWIEECGHCCGIGVIEIDLEPVEQEDLDEMAGAP